jgi:hypothetical protein
MGLVLLYANGMLNGVPPDERIDSWFVSKTVPIPETVPPSRTSSKDFLQELAEAQKKDAQDASGILTDEQVGIVPIRKANIGDLLSLIILKAGLLCALPIWFVLRVVDFVIGGPTRRRQSTRVGS